jgi:hypothetical protein
MGLFFLIMKNVHYVTFKKNEKLQLKLLDFWTLSIFYYTIKDRTFRKLDKLLNSSEKMESQHTQWVTLQTGTLSH